MSASIARLIVSVSLLPTLVGCVRAYVVAVETRTTPTLDVAARFQRVLIPGFLTVGRPAGLDVNEETVRVLRGQFRTKTSLRVIESADILPIAEMAVQDSWTATREPGEPEISSPRQNRGTDTPEGQALRVFANTVFWRHLGEEFADPLIITGTIVFSAQSRASRTPRDDFAQYDVRTRQYSDPDSAYVRTNGYSLTPHFFLIDGRTGRILNSKVFHEEVFYAPNQQVPVLSSYFELMNRIVPALLAAVSDQTVRTSRVLVK